MISLETAGLCDISSQTCVWRQKKKRKKKAADAECSHNLSGTACEMRTRALLYPCLSMADCLSRVKRQASQEGKHTRAKKQSGSHIGLSAHRTKDCDFYKLRRKFCRPGSEQLRGDSAQQNVRNRIWETLNLIGTDGSPNRCGKSKKLLERIWQRGGENHGLKSAHNAWRQAIILIGPDVTREG